METIRRDRINKILEDREYQDYVAKNEEAEKDRRFCRHNREHFLDVARIAQILNLREGGQVEDEWIYAAALLHDIGRFVQYADGTAHEKASVRLAYPILKRCGFDGAETEAVLKAIAGHRCSESAEKGGLESLLYRADKLSRSCFMCRAEAECDWKGNKKNRQLIW